MQHAPPQGDFIKFIIRLPVDLKEWIADQAKRNKGSQTTEIVRRLRDAKDQETANAR